MRLRNKPWAQDYIEENSKYIVNKEEIFRGSWQDRFEKNSPIWIEVGSGKGQFIVNMALKYPQYNFIGIEIQKSVIAVALKKVVKHNLPNLQLLYADGADLNNYFADGEVSKVFINFSDPWPKTKHAKRRLTYKNFLSTYKKILVPKGELEFKTDNQKLFEYSICSLNNYGLHFEKIWLDLHADSNQIDNVETEYEQKFSSLGQSIYKLQAHF